MNGTHSARRNRFAQLVTAGSTVAPWACCSVCDTARSKLQKGLIRWRSLHWWLASSAKLAPASRPRAVSTV